MLNWVENDKNSSADNGRETPDKEMNRRRRLCHMLLQTRVGLMFSVGTFMIL